MMLVLMRKEKQWIRITDKQGNVLRIQVKGIEPHAISTMKMVFEDKERNFEIHREEIGE